MKKTMKIQVRVARGIGITIDGKEPKDSFSVGESAKGFYCHEKLGSEKGVTIGDHEIKGIYFDCDLEDFKEGIDPTILCLTTDRDPILAKVTSVKEDPKDDTATLINAEDVYYDYEA